MECMICFQSDQLMNLECQHSFCQGCLKKAIQNKLNFNQDPLVCPDCGNQINNELLQKTYGSQYYNQINSQIFRKNLITPKEDDEKMINCINERCGAQFFIWKDSDYYTCQLCKQKFCLKCRGVFHEDLTCQQNKLKHIYTKSSIKLRNIEIQSGSKECPYCCCLIQKSAGCQIMTCKSDQCNGRNKFCFTCLTKFTDTGFSHFTERDSYKGKCIIPEGSDKQEPNKIPCPSCKTLDPQVCIIEKNFCELICACTVCKKVLCLKCGEKVNDKNFLQHMEQVCSKPKPKPQCIIQ